MNGTITWLHLSDLHAGKPLHGWDARRVTETLVEDLVRMQVDHSLHPDFIIFTGDAAFGQVGSGSGQTLAEQLALARQFLDAVRRAFHPAVRKDRLFLVPGNHDINRKAVGEDQIAWLDSQEDPQKTDLLMEKGDPQWQRYMERLATYRTFLQDSGYDHLLQDPDHLTYAVVRKVAGIKVGIAGFNSVWSCCRDSRLERGKLWMGAHWQLERMRPYLKELKDTGLTLALLHHPAGWLVEPEDVGLWRALERDFRFILHGHEHQEWVTQGHDGWTHIAAGACYERSDKANGYNFVRLDLDTGQGEVWLREYEPKGGGWGPGYVHGKTDTMGLWPLDHLRWLKPESSPLAPPLPRRGEDSHVPVVSEVAESRQLIHQAYFGYLKAELKDHIIRGFAPQVRGNVLSLPISEIFLPLRAVEGRPAVAEYAEEDLRLQAAREAVGELDWQRRMKELEKRYAQLSARQAAQRRLTLAELLKEPRSVLLGDPGAGKTTITRYVTYALAAGDMTHIGEGARGLVPVLIRIANFAKACELDPTLHLIGYIERELTPRPEFGPYLRWAIENGLCLVILDGLDEVGAVELRTTITDRIREMVAAYSDNRFMVTSRIVGYERSPLTQEFRHATLMELEQEDRVRFIRLWHAAIQQATSESAFPGSADNLIDALREKPQMARIAANPLLLTIIVLRHCYGVKLPNRRVQVYQSATDTLVEYWTAQRGVLELDAEEIKNILAPVAHYILSSNVAGVITHQELLPRFHEGIMAQRGCELVAAQRIGRKMLRNLNEDSGLFLERGRDVNGEPVYGFLHQTFGEYLAGLFLAQAMQSGEFELGRYIHHSVWREPLLLMAGHLSIYSQPQANQLIRDILRYVAPYEDVLQRNTLLAAECLADDVHVKPPLRDEVLEKLARVLGHGAPQLQEAAVTCYRQLAVTRHREAAVLALKRMYPLTEGGALNFPVDVRLKLATVLVHLGERDAAGPILETFERGQYRESYSLKARQLRFEGWPEEAAEFLVRMPADSRSGFPIRAGRDLASFTLGPVDAELARRVLGESGLLSVVEVLSTKVDSEQDRMTLCWLAAITPEASPPEAFIGLVSPESPAGLRLWAATRLLTSEYRSIAIATLQELAENRVGFSVEAAEALLMAGEKVKGSQRLVRDAALMAEYHEAPTAIATLLKSGDEELGVAAALHFLATYNPSIDHDPEPLWTVTTVLVDNSQSREVGLAAARWLALLPGYKHRIRACELLLEEGLVQQAIPLLQYLAYECHDEACQQACWWLLKCREGERVLPILVGAAQQADRQLQYQACLALALADQLQPEEAQAPRRSELKEAIQGERAQAYRDALLGFCRTGLDALQGFKMGEREIQEAQALCRLTLRWLREPFASFEQVDEWTAVCQSEWPAVKVNCAAFNLRAGHIEHARQRLLEILAEGGPDLSKPIRLRAVRLLGLIVAPETTQALVAALGDNDVDMRLSAAEALCRLGDPSAVQPLVAALSDEYSFVRVFAAQALGSLGDPSAVQPLVAALGDEDSNVRFSAAEVLGSLGDPTAVQPLIAVLSDEAGVVRMYAAEALGSLGDIVAVQPLIAALSDEDSYVRRSAAEALGSLGDPSALQPLVIALNDEDTAVRESAAGALGSLGDPSAVQPFVAALSHEDSGARRMAAAALGSLGDIAAVQPLIAALGDEDSSVRTSAVYALGRLGDPSAVQPLVATLGDEDGSRRGYAAVALSSLGDPSAVQPLVAALSDTVGRVRVSAAFALGKLGDPTAVQPLIAALSDEAKAVRMYAAEALGSLGDIAAVQPLIAALSDEVSYVRRSAAEALGSLGDPSAQQPLVIALNDEDTAVRESAAEALGSLGDPSAVQPLVAALNHEDCDVRRTAAAALGRLGDIAAVQPLIAALGDEDPYMRVSAAEALGRLGAAETAPIVRATLSMGTVSGLGYASNWVQALVHLEPQGALQVLERYASLFRRESWVPRLRGQALLRLGDRDAALTSLKAAVEMQCTTTNMLSLCHFFIEQGDLQLADQQVRRALDRSHRESLVVLSQAVLQWEMGHRARALELLTQTQRGDRQITQLKDLSYDHFWGRRALSVVETMVAEAAASRTVPWT